MMPEQEAERNHPARTRTYGSPPSCPTARRAFQNALQSASPTVDTSGSPKKRAAEERPPTEAPPAAATRSGGTQGAGVRRSARPDRAEDRLDDQGRPLPHLRRLRTMACRCFRGKLWARPGHHRGGEDPLSASKTPYAGPRKMRIPVPGASAQTGGILCSGAGEVASQAALYRGLGTAGGRDVVENVRLRVRTTTDRRASTAAAWAVKVRRIKSRVIPESVGHRRVYSRHDRT